MNFCSLNSPYSLNHHVGAMLVFRMLCAITQSSDAHRTESVSVMDHEQTMGVSSRVLDRKQQNIFGRLSLFCKWTEVTTIGWFRHRWAQFSEVCWCSPMQTLVHQDIYHCDWWMKLSMYLSFLAYIEFHAACYVTQESRWTTLMPTQRSHIFKHFVAYSTY